MAEHLVEIQQESVSSSSTKASCWIWDLSLVSYTRVCSILQRGVGPRAGVLEVAEDLDPDSQVVVEEVVHLLVVEEEEVQDSIQVKEEVVGVLHQAGAGEEEQDHPGVAEGEVVLTC